jgi:hypothetical protein
MTKSFDQSPLPNKRGRPRSKYGRPGRYTRISGVSLDGRLFFERNGREYEVHPDCVEAVRARLRPTQIEYDLSTPGHYGEARIDENGHPHTVTLRRGW